LLASSVKQALTLCASHRPLVGLLDADVLQEHGLAAVTQLREIQPTIRLCLVDAGAPGPPTEELRALGVVHCLSKPFSLRQLAELLNELCRP
jgi:CheY-like chemotaxis protein